jgi:hypothetical protein
MKEYDAIKSLLYKNQKLLQYGKGCNIFEKNSWEGQENGGIKNEKCDL